MIKATNSKHAWLDLIAAVRENGRSYIDQEKRHCTEIINFLLDIDDASDCADIVREMQRHEEWVYPAIDELKSIVFGVAPGSHEYSYGPRLFGEPNQIDGFVIPLLRASPETRRALVILYKAETDSKIASKNIPGLVSLYFRIINNSLTCTCHIRSNDVLIGFPASLYQIYCIQEYVAEKLGVKTGLVTIFSTSAHYFREYDNQYEAVVKSLAKKPLSDK